jgi:UDPglucose 6-dehydrogenase
VKEASSVDIAVVGLWHLGSVATAGWMNARRSVVAWDPDVALRSEIAAGRGVVTEPGLNEALEDGLTRGLLEVVAELSDAISRTPITHLTFDTAVGSSGRHNDPRLDKAVQVFASAAPDDALLLVSSQVPVGTSSGWRKVLQSQQRGLLIAHVPENLRLGRAVEDFVHPDRLLIGADDDAAWSRASVAFEQFFEHPLRMGLAAAEMAKHATNAYLALCTAFGNELAWLALAAGADPAEVVTGLRADPRVSPSAPLRPGAAFSGATLTRDLMALRDLGAISGRPELFDAMIAVNERHAGIALAWVEDSLGVLRGKRVAVAGLTYKPGTSTLRDSLPLRLVGELLERGAAVNAWDPSAERLANAPEGLTRKQSLKDCVRDADALVVMTALPEIAETDWAGLKPRTRLVVDGCMGVDRRAAEAAGWVYRGLAVV